MAGPIVVAILLAFSMAGSSHGRRPLHPDSVTLLEPTGAPQLTDQPQPVVNQDVPAINHTDPTTGTETSSGTSTAVPSSTTKSSSAATSTPAATEAASEANPSTGNPTTTAGVVGVGDKTTLAGKTSTMKTISTTGAEVAAATVAATEAAARPETEAGGGTTTSPETDAKFSDCAPPEFPRWRTLPKTHKLRLSRANAACSPSCDSNRTGNETLQSLLSLGVQALDDIELSLDPGEDWWAGNSSRGELQMSLQSVQGATQHPCFLDDSLLLWTKSYLMPGITFGHEILTPGNHALSVHLTGSEASSCSVSWLLNVSVHSRECGRFPGDTCSGGGACVLERAQASYSCRCCPGLGGRYCEERDGCFEKPCQNGGFCVDIAEGLAGFMFQCLCPRGFRGRRCEERLGPCEQQPCPQGTKCIPLTNSSRTCEEVTSPALSSAASTTVPVMKDAEPVTSKTTTTQSTPDAASSSSAASSGSGACAGRPCVHGMCEERAGSSLQGEASFKCYCLPGYGGDLCEFEYDECDSGPCSHGAVCEDLVAAFRCHCGPGYAGRRCEIKVDLCRPNPCPAPAQCLDRGNNYSCLCHPGYDGPGCTQRYDPCFPNPCQNGGSCWPSMDSFYCSCARGFSGDTCDTLQAYIQSDAKRPDALPRRGGPPPDAPAADAAGHSGSGPVDQLHNIYIAAATLAGACLIVLAVVTVCHCRVHHSYRGCARRLGRSCAQLKQHTLPRQILAEPAWERF